MFAHSVVVIFYLLSPFPSTGAVVVVNVVATLVVGDADVVVTDATSDVPVHVVVVHVVVSSSSSSCLLL